MLPARASISSLIGTSFSLISRNTEHIQHSMSIAVYPSIPALASTVPCHLVSCNTTLHHSTALRTPSPGTVMRHATTTRQLATLANIQYSQQYVWFLSVFVVMWLWLCYTWSGAVPVLVAWCGCVKMISRRKLWLFRVWGQFYRQPLPSSTRQVECGRAAGEKII